MGIRATIGVSDKDLKLILGYLEERGVKPNPEGLTTCTIGGNKFGLLIGNTTYLQVIADEIEWVGSGAFVGFLVDCGLSPISVFDILSQMFANPNPPPVTCSNCGETLQGEENGTENQTPEKKPRLWPRYREEDDG